MNRAKGFVYILEAADGKCRVMAYVPYGPTTDQAAQKTLTEFPRYVIDAVERILLSPTDYAMHRIPAPTPPMTVNYPAEVDNWYSRYINARGKPQRTLSVELHGGLSRSGPDKAPSEVILGGFVAFVPDAVPPIDQPSGQAAVRGDAPAH